MMSRLSDLAGCAATAEEFFPSAVACSQPGAVTGLKSALPDKVQYDPDSSPGAELVSLLRQVDSATNHSKHLVFGRSEEELTTRVRPNSWSVAECLEHLALTTRVFLPPIAEIIGKTPRLGKKRPLRCDTLARVLIRMLEPPYRLRHKVLAHLAPQRHDFPSAWKAFLESQEDVEQIVRSAAGLAIDTTKIQSPVCSRVSYSVYGALGILSAHQRRHLWQVEQILRALDRRAA